MQYLLQRALLITCLSGSVSTSVLAQSDVIGVVKTAAPDAAIVSNGRSTPAVPGTPVMRKSILHTGAQGSLGVTFKDNTRISIGPDTEVSVDDYLYAPSKGDLQLGASISKGTLEYVSGVIAKLKPEAVSIKTPTGTIGVRGTKFVVKVEAAQ